LTGGRVDCFAIAETIDPTPLREKFKSRTSLDFDHLLR